MRIGFDITALYIAQGGIFYFDYHLARALLEHRGEHEISLLDYRPVRGSIPASSQVRELERSGAVTSCRGMRHRRLARWEPVRRGRLRPLAEWVDRVLFWPWASLADGVMRHRLGRALPELDVFHSSEVVLWRHPRALNVVTLYDLTALLFPEFHTRDTIAVQRRKIRFAQEAADIVIAISEATKRDVVTHLGIPEERVHVVHGGVDPFFQPLADEVAMTRVLASLGLRPGEYILHVGTLEPRKNLVRLIDAYERVRRMLGPGMPKLALVGANGWQYRDVFERVEALGLENSVVFLGQVLDDILRVLYNGAALFIYPSLYEGFGLPPLEAMACGTPVIVSNSSSLPEVVGDAGVLVDPYDVTALAVEITELLGDRARRVDLSARGLRRATAFNWMRSAVDLLSAYSVGRISH